VRSRAAAAVLSREGFKEAYSMEGGIRAWNGLRAAGPPEAGMAYFDPAHTPEEMIALAWMLEEGACKFYTEMGKRQKGPEEAALFRDLSDDEDKHKSFLFNLYQKGTGKEADSGFPRSLLSLEEGVDYLEGGVVLNKALEWAQGQELRNILDFSVSLEVNAIDLYIKMERRVEGPEAKEVFQSLSNQERDHLKRLTAAIEKHIP
jgi:rubrerythrin